MRVKLTDEQRKRFIDSAHDTLDAIGYDCGWAERTPSKSEFLDVMLDILYDGIHVRKPWTNEERELWHSLSNAEQRRIVFAVGP
jgi:hypothetical protein